MKYCTRCGNQVEAGQVCHCSIKAKTFKRQRKITLMDQVFEAVSQCFEALKRCYVSMKNRMGIGEKERNTTDCYERDQLIIPENVKPIEGEITVKQYNIAVIRTLLRFERAEGRMQVTNKRLIFRAPGRAFGGRTTLQQEFAVEEIAGIEARRGFFFSLLHLIGGCLLISLTGYIATYINSWIYSISFGLGVILGLLFVAAGMISFFMIPRELLLKLAMLGVSSSAAFMLFTYSYRYPTYIIYLTGIIFAVNGLTTLICLFLHFMRPDLVIIIKNKLGIGDGPVSLKRKTLKAYEVLPTDESEGALREVGAIIEDIQTLGEVGVKKWVNTV